MGGWSFHGDRTIAVRQFATLVPIRRGRIWHKTHSSVRQGHIPHTQINKQQQSIDYNLLHLSLLLPANIDFIFQLLLSSPPARQRQVGEKRTQSKIWNGNMDFSLLFLSSFCFYLSLYSYFSSPLLFSPNPRLVTIPFVASVCVHERPDSPLNWVVLIREQTFYFGDASAKMHGIKRAEGMLSCRWRECVYMCYCLRSRFPFVCVCVWAEKKKGHTMWLREAEDG